QRLGAADAGAARRREVARRPDRRRRGAAVLAAGASRDRRAAAARADPAGPQGRRPEPGRDLARAGAAPRPRLPRDLPAGARTPGAGRTWLTTTPSRSASSRSATAPPAAP